MATINLTKEDAHLAYSLILRSAQTIQNLGLVTDETIKKRIEALVNRFERLARTA